MHGYSQSEMFNPCFLPRLFFFFPQLTHVITIILMTTQMRFRNN
ncbi:hypothetical protein WN943_026735 [Citrus x changshan-huyou]